MVYSFTQENVLPSSSDAEFGRLTRAWKSKHLDIGNLKEKKEYARCRMHLWKEKPLMFLVQGDLAQEISHWLRGQQVMGWGKNLGFSYQHGGHNPSGRKQEMLMFTNSWPFLCYLIGIVCYFTVNSLLMLELKLKYISGNI